MCVSLHHAVLTMSFRCVKDDQLRLQCHTTWFQAHTLVPLRSLEEINSRTLWNQSSASGMAILRANLPGLLNITFPVYVKFIVFWCLSSTLHSNARRNALSRSSSAANVIASSVSTGPNRVKQAQRNRVKEGKGTKERDPVQVRVRVHARMLEMQQCRLCRLVMRKMSLTAEHSGSGPPLPFYADPVFSKWALRNIGYKYAWWATYLQSRFRPSLGKGLPQSDIDSSRSAQRSLLFCKFTRQRWLETVSTRFFNLISWCMLLPLMCCAVTTTASALKRCHCRRPRKGAALRELRMNSDTGCFPRFE